MKRYLPLLGVFVLILANPASAQGLLDKKLSISLKRTTLEDALYTLMDEAHVNLTFSNDLIPEKTISLNLKDQSLKVVLSTLLRGTGLGYQLVGNQVVLHRSVLPKKKQKFTISGFLEDAETGERLIGASVWDLDTGQGTVTNVYGFFSLTLERGQANVRFSYIGYEPVTERYLLNRNYNSTIFLRRSLTLPEVEVTISDTSDFEYNSGVSSLVISAKDIESMPSLGGEPDLIRHAHLLPGIKTGTDGLGGLMVRGGSLGQNLILIDGVPLYNFNHGAGLFSVVNPLAISKATIIKGGFPARYSGRLSSVVDIRTREGNKHKFEGRVDLSLLSGRLSLEGPIVKGKSSFFASGRLSYLNWFISPLAENYKADRNQEGTTKYDFYDLNLKLNHQFSARDRLFLSVYKGSDQYLDDSEEEIFVKTPVATEYVRRVLTHEDAYTWGNTTASLRWNHIFSDRLFANTTLTYSKLDVNYNTLEQDQAVLQVQDSLVLKILNTRRFESNIEDVGGRIDFDYILSPQHTVHLGANVVRHKLTPGALSFDEDREYLQDAFNNTEQRSLEIAGYIEDEFRPFASLVFNLGVSFVNWRLEGGDYRSWQPRFSAYWEAGRNFGLKASYSGMAQFIHRLSQFSIGLPTDLWVASTERTPPQTSRQVGFGVDFRTPQKINIGIEGYYKRMKNILNYTEGAVVLLNWENNVTRGTGRAYGVEFFAEKRTSNFSWNLNYTLSWSDRKFEQINNGERFPFQFDRRHDLKIGIRKPLTDWLTFSANWVYNTGFATTLPVENFVWFVSDPRPGAVGVTAQDFGSKNNFRMPDYHRLDLSLRAKYEAEKSNHFFGIGVYNAYDRRNPLYYRLRNEYGYVDGDFTVVDRSFVQAWLVPFTPYFNYSIRF